MNTAELLQKITASMVAHEQIVPRRGEQFDVYTVPALGNLYELMPA